MKTIKIGPIGISSSFKKIKWDDMGYNIISHIIVSFDTSRLTSIKFGYIKNGALVMSKRYGSSPSGCSTRLVRLKHDSEFVTGISGETYRGHIISLTFHTNQRKREAFHLTDKKGTEKVEFHSEILECREFGGFFGTYKKDYFSIGIHVRLLLPGVKKIKEEKL